MLYIVYQGATELLETDIFALGLYKFRQIFIRTQLFIDIKIL